MTFLHWVIAGYLQSQKRMVSKVELAKLGLEVPVKLPYPSALSYF